MCCVLAGHVAAGRYLPGTNNKETAPFLQKKITERSRRRRFRQALNCTLAQGFHSVLPPPTSRAEPPKGLGLVKGLELGLGLGGRVLSGDGLVWAAQRSFSTDLHIGSHHT